MEKFLSIPVTSSGNILISATNVVMVEAAADSATSLSTLITYQGGRVVTITHAAQVAFSMRNAIQDAIIASLQTPWTNVVYDVTVPQAVGDIDVSSIIVPVS
jgi:hypothetical protein